MTSLRLNRILPSTIAALLLTGGDSALAANRFVSLSGVAAGPGSLQAPWNFGYAASHAQPGDVVFIRAGVYANPYLTEITVSGTPNAPITFTAYQNEQVAIDGTGAWRTMPNNGDMFGLVTLTGRSYVILENLEIRKLATTNTSDVVGLLIRGGSHHITVRRCNIHHIETTLSSPDGTQGTANGIAVLGDSSWASVNNITIDQCEVHHLKTGWSESVTFNGNVEDFRITNCNIHDCNNIGIDCIGYERVAASGGPNDRARRGLVQGNLVSGIDSAVNPAYAGSRSADGIYVDGAQQITIQQNRVTNCNIGIELGCEHPGNAAEGCTVRNNQLWRNHLGGIFVGGAEPGSSGGAVGNLIHNNTLYQNDVSPERMGEVVIQCYAINNTIKQNIIIPSSQNNFVNSWSGVGNRGNVVDWNVYYSASALKASQQSKWLWNGNFRQGFGAWKVLSGQDANSVFTDPKFASKTGSLIDLHVLETSGARDRCDPTFNCLPSDVDIDGQPRAGDGKMDAGADEYVKATKP